MKLVHVRLPDHILTAIKLRSTIENEESYQDTIRKILDDGTKQYQREFTLVLERLSDEQKSRLLNGRPSVETTNTAR